MTTISDAAYWKDLGAKAFLAGKKIDECPFGFDMSERRLWWRMGWQSQSKKSGI